MEYGVIGIDDGAGLGGGMQDRGFKAWPGLGLVTALALVLERWYGVVSWWWSTAEKKKKKNRQRRCQTYTPDVPGVVEGLHVT